MFSNKAVQSTMEDTAVLSAVNPPLQPLQHVEAATLSLAPGHKSYTRHPCSVLHENTDLNHMNWNYYSTPRNLDEVSISCYQLTNLSCWGPKYGELSPNFP